MRLLLRKTRLTWLVLFPLVTKTLHTLPNLYQRFDVHILPQIRETDTLSPYLDILEIYEMGDASLLPADITFAGKDANLPFKFLLFLKGFSIIPKSAGSNLIRSFPIKSALRGTGTSHYKSR